MVKKGNSKRRLGIMLMVVSVLVVGITATGYADQLSGPAVVGGTLTVVGNSNDVTVSVSLSNGQCRGTKGISPSGTNNGTLPNGLTLGDITAARLLEGLRFSVPGVIVSSGCLKDSTGVKLIVKAVNPSTFQQLDNGVGVMADVVLLFVVSP